MIFTPKLRSCRLSIIFTLSKANEDMVVREPQKPMAIRKAYFESKFNEDDTTE
jgi:hypothetical protein